MPEHDLKDAVPIQHAAKLFPMRCHASTCVRWALQGVWAGAQRVKLETFIAGGRRFTNQEAADRFVQATTAASKAQAPKELANPIAREREKQIAEAEAVCRRAGI